MSNLNDGGIAAESICKYIIGGDKAVRRGRFYLSVLSDNLFFIFLLEHLFDNKEVHR